MAQQNFTGHLYIPSDILADDQSDTEQFFHKNNAAYEQEVNNMLATILETNRQMDVTGQSIVQNLQNDIQEFIMFQQKYPHLVKKLQKKFKKFNLTTSQLLKFIKIEQKFMNFNLSNQPKNETIIKIDKETKLQQPRKSRKNLVQVHGILIRKKSYKLNPRMYH